MDLSILLGRLQKVRKMGADKWQACCPAHDDRSPSLAIKETADGRILLHCFGGCGTDAVLGALGLEMIDLMPERLDHSLAPIRKPWTGDDALRCLAYEAGVVGLVTSDLMAGKEHTDADLGRFFRAASNINKALEYVDGISR